MIKLLQTEDFFCADDSEKLYRIANSLRFSEHEYGEEIENFNFIIPGLDPVFSRLLGEEVVVDEDCSGVFRKPKTSIHFESFNGPKDWIFIVALEPTIFNLYFHVPSKTRSALEEYRLDYKNFLNWDYYTNILLNRNQGIIFRPWLFHSLQNGLVQIYRLTGKENVPDRV